MGFHPVPEKLHIKSTGNFSLTIRNVPQSVRERLNTFQNSATVTKSYQLFRGNELTLLSVRPGKHTHKAFPEKKVGYPPCESQQGKDIIVRDISLSHTNGTSVHVGGW